MKRLYAVSFVVFFGILIVIRFCASLLLPFSAAGGVMLLFVFPLFLPVWVALAGLIAWPIEKAISEMYFRDAQRMLRERPEGPDQNRYYRIMGKNERQVHPGDNSQ